MTFPCGTAVLLKAAGRPYALKSGYRGGVFAYTITYEIDGFRVIVIEPEPSREVVSISYVDDADEEAAWKAVIEKFELLNNITTGVME